MANVWESAVITNKGIALQAKMLAGGKAVKITSVKSGSGSVQSATLMNQTSVSGIKQSLTVKPLQKIDHTVILTAMLVNDGVTTAYDLRQVGFYAEDPDEGEILYMIAQNTEARHVPTEAEVPGYSLIWNFHLTLSNGVNIEVNVDPAAYVNERNLEERLSRLDIATMTGESIVATDSLEAPLYGLSLFGKSTQEGTPTPDTPFDIISCGESGNITTLFSGECLVDISTVTKTGNCVFRNKGNHIHYENNTGEACYVKTKKILLPKGIYTAYIKNISSKNNNYTLGVQTDTKSYYLHATQKIFTFELENAENVALQITTDNTTDNDVWEGHIGIVYGRVPIEKCPEIVDMPIPQTIVLTMPDTLNGLKVTSGGNYIDANGQQWLCDEIDFAQKKRVQRLAFVDFSNAVGVRKEFPEGSGRYRIDFVLATNKSFVSGIAEYGMCSALTFSHKPLSANELDNAISCYNMNGGLYVRCDRFNSANDFVEWSKSVDLKVIYPLLEPIEKPLTVAEIEAYKALYTNYPYTTVLNDSNAGMMLKYATSDIGVRVAEITERVGVLEKRPVNNNILINSNFANPVNQRGYNGEVTTESMYTIDRWRMNAGQSFDVSSKGITFKKASATGYFVQKIEASSLKGKNVTLSMKINGKVHSLSTNISEENISNSMSVDEYSRIYLDYDIYNDIVTCGLSFYNGAAPTIEWAKLELGDKDTSYSPRLYDEEFLMCQRYFQIFHMRDSKMYLCNDDTVAFCKTFFTPMRVAPSCDVSELKFFSNTAELSGFTLDHTVSTKEVNVIFTKNSHGMTYSSYLSVGGNIKLDSEL